MMVLVSKPPSVYNQPRKTWSLLDGNITFSLNNEVEVGNYGYRTDH